MTLQVHWHEGLFLQPHHLQVMSRAGDERAAGLRRQLMPYPWGVAAAKLSTDALQNMRIQFDTLHAILPSGVEVHVPENADLPVLDIKQVFEASSAPLTVGLAVPVWDARRANTVSDGDGDAWRSKRVYRLGEIERTDENTGENPQPIPIRRLNARLILDSDDPTDLEVLPLLRITRSAGDEAGLPRVDPTFVPPCLLIGGSVVLRDLLRDLANQVGASRQALVVQLSRGGFSIETMRGLQFEQVLRLQTLNRFTARLTALADAPVVTPFNLYLELRDMLGELAALQPGNDPFDAPRYDHERPYVALGELDRKLRGLLGGAVSEPWWKLPLTRQGEAAVVALEEKHLNEPSQYFMGIRTREDPQSLAALVQDGNRFKVMATSLATRTIYGVKLQEERNPPLGLPSQSDLHYFRLLRSESTRMWDRIVAEKGIAVVWPNVQATDYELTLYMTLPADRSSA